MTGNRKPFKAGAVARGLILVGGTAWFASIFRAAGEPWYVWPIFWLGYRTYVRRSIR